jgi:hypothetical protein
MNLSGLVFQKYRQLKGGSVFLKTTTDLMGWYDVIHKTVVMVDR